MEEKSQMNPYLFIAIVNLFIVGGMVAISYVLQYFSLTDTHILMIIKNIFTSKPFTLKNLSFIFLTFYFYSTIMLFIYTLCMRSINKWFIDLLFALLFTVLFMYVFPYFSVHEFHVDMYNRPTIIHTLCLIVLYSIFFGETIRYHRLFSV